MVSFVKRIAVSVFLYSVGMFYCCMVLCRLLWSVIREGTHILKCTPIEQGIKYLYNCIT
jgi:hypothetical protein